MVAFCPPVWELLFGAGYSSSQGCPYVLIVPKGTFPIMPLKNRSLFIYIYLIVCPYCLYRVNLCGLISQLSTFIKENYFDRLFESQFSFPNYHCLLNAYIIKKSMARARKLFTCVKMLTASNECSVFVKYQ